MRDGYVANTFEYKGFTVKIIPDSDAEEPDYGDAEIFISAESKGCSYNSYRIGRKDCRDGECHLPWGEGKWGTYGEEGPEEAEEGESEAWDLYVEWREQFDPSYVVYPIHCGNAHGPGSFQIWEVDASEDPDRIEGYVFIKVPVGDLERLADTRDLEKMKDGIIEMYEQWSNGDVYGYVIEDSDGEEVEDGSCWGYYGTDDCESEAKSVIDHWGDRYKKKVTLVVLKKDWTWEYRTVEVPLFVGDDHVVEWAREHLGISEEDDVQELHQAADQQVLFADLQEQETA